MSHAGPSARDVAAFTSLSVASRKPRATSVRRSFLLWTAVEQKKQRSYASERPYEAHLLEAERALARGDALLIAAQADIEKDLKRTFPSLQGYGMLSEGATRNVLIAHAQRNPAVGYCQSLNYVCAALLMVPLSEEDAFFSLCTVVEDLMPPDYYTRENDILGARVDQLVYSTLLGSRLPRLAGHLLDLGCPISLFSIQWFMCLFAKDLPLALTLRVWDVFFVYGDHALFAVGLVMMQMGEARVLSCRTLEEVYDELKAMGTGLQQRDAEAAHRLVTASLEAR